MSAELTHPVRPVPPRRQTRKGPGSRLRTAILALTNGKGQIGHHAERAWASITFTGTRHTLRLTFEGDQAVAAGEDFVAILPEHEFAIPGQLVADATISSVEHTLLPQPRMLVECELLLLNDA